MARHKSGDGACAIAAGLNLAAIGIENLHETIAVLTRRVNDQKLVAALRLHVLARRQSAHVIARQGQRAIARVDNDEIIAQPVHFGKGDGGVCIHCAYIGVSAVKRHIALSSAVLLDLSSMSAYFAATS